MGAAWWAWRQHGVGAEAHSAGLPFVPLRHHRSPGARAMVLQSVGTADNPPRRLGRHQAVPGVPELAMVLLVREIPVSPRAAPLEFRT